MLTELSFQMEHNTHIMKKEAEKELLAMMEVERELQVTVHEKKRQYHLREKQKQLNNLLDAQVTSQSLFFFPHIFLLGVVLRSLN